ncbi:hypothetical protein [Flavobacterium wongokense]|uniref:hypothetical protein n=1 Tax=Flavobacterium wongokense TaxID=2910674 RepID=UPI001F489A17|nr:hypothetical protein [Flavobacterium sp. WG47]MCF6133529.1 hypothetical protein [Flavobacterium sp. WG47]
MKKLALFILAIGASYSSIAQSKTITNQDLASRNDLAIVSYHVEERINMNFGGSIRTYNVPNLNMITPKDLGVNNVRIITPKYGKIKAKAVAVEILSNKEPKNFSGAIKSEAKPVKVDVLPPKKQREFVNIDVVATYERTLDKGYRSVDMLTKVADRHFFDGDLVLAAKWYAELFDRADNLDAVYYYRYAQALKAVNKNAKAAEMMKIFETKSL